MNIRHIASSSLAALALVASSLTFAAQPASEYRYGQALDVKEVISLQEADARYCEVVEARMVYLDSAGAVQAVTYLKQADNCHNQG
ncbi:DUF2790 domain-containing protein [Aquipseudomonas alcaligenes]|uniref:DUF2790 domain-containing protein n=1 Tax=Aquipseudomonas alcaligenes TaxID=43263 RepID=UPI0037479188